ncbi:MAG TPA: YncE family protein [Bryobacteraceae bacterium]|jgi:DNA-binding beta-propeller fold protein YncE
MKRLFAVVLVAAAAFAAEGYHVLNKIKIGGTGGWDYVTADGANHRLYVSHGTNIAIVDTTSGSVLGTVDGLDGVHGIAIADKLNKGFISNGRSNMVTVFNLSTFAKTAEVPTTGQNPDAICYEPKTERVFTFNGRSGNSTAIDAKSNAVVATFPLGGKPEFCAVAGDGKIYDNLEDKSELVEIDAAKPAVIRTAKLDPCDGPSGLAIDAKDGVLFSVCGNKMMAVTDIKEMKVIATPEIGQGPDAAGYDPGAGIAFSSNGRDGTLTLVKQVNGKWQPVETVTTERGARTMAVDTVTHKVYLLTAEFGPMPPAQPGQRVRPPILPDTFHVLVVGE